MARRNVAKGALGQIMSLRNRNQSHYSVHITEAEYIALKMLAKRQERPRQPTVTLRHFSWEKKQDA
jgi:hypothetical protein